MGLYRNAQSGSIAVTASDRKHAPVRRRSQHVAPALRSYQHAQQEAPRRCARAVWRARKTSRCARVVLVGERACALYSTRRRRRRAAHLPSSTGPCRRTCRCTARRRTDTRESPAGIPPHEAAAGRPPLAAADSLALAAGHQHAAAAARLVHARQRATAARQGAAQRNDARQRQRKLQRQPQRHRAAGAAPGEEDPLAGECCSAAGRVRCTRATLSAAASNVSGRLIPREAVPTHRVACAVARRAPRRRRSSARSRSASAAATRARCRRRRAATRAAGTRSGARSESAQTARRRAPPCESAVAPPQRCWRQSDATSELYE